MTLDITLDDLVAKCGAYKRIGQEYAFQCPSCMDKGKDNLLYNPKKGVVWCMACSEHAPALLSEIMKEKQPPPPIEGIPQWKLEQEAYFEYQDECNSALLNNNKALDYLKEHRHIDKDAVEKIGIGYDFDDNKWVFPIIRYFDSQMVGFRYRGGDFTNKQLWSEKDTPSCLGHIYGNKINKNLYICEGEIDAACMYMMLRDNDRLENSTIISPSTGVSSLEKCINELTFSNFEKIHLCLDNDIIKKPKNVSLKMTEKLISKYPFIIDKTPQFTDDELRKGYKDIADWMELNML